MKYYHGTNKHLSMGTVLKKTVISPPHIWDSHDADFEEIEFLSEELRPNNRPSRLESIFLVVRINDIEEAMGSQPAYVYQVVPIGDVFKTHSQWLGEAYFFTVRKKRSKSVAAIAELDRKIEECIANYWMGKPTSAHGVYEFLCNSARITKLVKGSA
jgi:hypothetical protein